MRQQILTQQILQLNKLAPFDNYTSALSNRSLHQQLRYQFNNGNVLPQPKPKPVPAFQSKVNNKDLNSEFKPVSKVMAPGQPHQRALKGKMIKQSHKNFLFPEKKKASKKDETVQTQTVRPESLIEHGEAELKTTESHDKVMFQPPRIKIKNEDTVESQDERTNDAYTSNRFLTD